VNERPRVEWVPGPAHRLAATAIARALRATAMPRFAVPGGRSAAAVFDALIALPRAERPDWSRVDLLFADERAVAPDDPESNYRLAREHLIEPANLPASHVHRLRGEALDLERAAREAELDFEPPVDVLLLGVGEDGHVASIFPESPLVRERERRVVVVEESPKPPPRRLTITPRVIEEARVKIVLAEGEAKRDAVQRALADLGSPEQTPARLVRQGLWFVGSMGPPEFVRER